MHYFIFWNFVFYWYDNIGVIELSEHAKKHEFAAMDGNIHNITEDIS